MFEEKNISIDEAKNRIISWVRSADSSSINFLLERVFGVLAKPGDNSDLIIKPSIDYRDTFGEFEIFVEPRPTQCECKSKEGEWKLFKENCVCERKREHYHCKKCGGLISVLTSESQSILFLPKLFGKEVSNPLYAIDELLKLESPLFIIDASETIFIDSFSIGLLVTAKKKIENENKTIKIILSPHLRKHFEATKLDSLFEEFV